MPKVKESKVTPLMKQYNAIKAKHPGALLLFRVGDFYETFGEDAIKASQILDIVLTKRANGAASEIELAGFPHHALDSYLPKLVRAGNRVAICDQLEDPKTVKGIVKRGVTELVTPGVSFNDNVLEKKHNNYLASIHKGEKCYGVSFLDVSTGEFLTSEGDVELVAKLFKGFNPAEVLFSKNGKDLIGNLIGNEWLTCTLDDWIFGYEFGYEKLTRHFGTSSLKGFGIEGMQEAITASGAILHYLEETEHRELGHIASISRIEEDQHVWLDQFTIRNLELIHPAQDGGVPLIDVIDHTHTPMGSRLLRRWLIFPLKDLGQVKERHKMVEQFVMDDHLRENILKNLRQMSDLERLVSKVAVKRINPRELNHLKKSLELAAPIKEWLEKTKNAALKKMGQTMDPCTNVIQKIDRHLQDEVPLTTSQGGIIKEGVNKELDHLREICFSGKDYLVDIQKRESERTGIPSLKIAYNKVFGYYLEVTNAHKDKVPEDWIRKQTLVNAERYITEELKEYENKILTAEEKLIALEQSLFQELVNRIGEFLTPIQQNAKALATIDCLISFSIIAKKQKYCKPDMVSEPVMDIREGRHAVIEQQLPLGETYVPNDLFLENKSQQILVITGPNMAGKSAFLRQTALIVLLAQMGSFVPAKSATIGIVDKIYTRVGASDNLSRGESTFMVEMIETASILNNISEHCLILMDEIGRGTSTYDGVSIAWSIVEYLHNHPKRPKTLFATHYHELNQLANDLPRIKNYNVSVKEVGEKVLFLRKLKEGGSEHSFGIHVAQMAGMPNPIVLRANEIMKFLEKDKAKNQEKQRIKDIPTRRYQMMLFENDPRFEQVMNMMEELDINTISPVEALLKLNEIVSILKNN